MLGTYTPFLITAVGIAHAVAAFCYFSKARHGLTWAIAWLSLTISVVAMLTTAPRLAFAGFGAAVIAWTAWWATMRPSNVRRWVAENAHLAKGTFVGTQLSIENVRSFTWLGKGRHEARWQTRTYDTDQLDAVDLLVSTWGNPHIGHMLISFTFSNADPLCFSIETRRERTERWSTLAGFFKAYEIIIIPADETDHVHARTNVRREHVRLFRLNVDQPTAQRLLAAYVRDMNALGLKPKFYHTLWTNCTTEIARLVRAIGVKTPLDWRLVLTGHIPAYLYRLGILGQGLPYASLNAQADIGERARQATSDGDFSSTIRVNLYDPRKHTRAIDAPSADSETAARN